MLKQRHQLFVTLFACTDAASAFGACALAWWIRRAQFAEPDLILGSYVEDSLTILVVPILAITMIAMGLYKPRRDQSILSEIVDVTRASIVAMVLVIVSSWVLGGVVGSTQASASVVGPTLPKVIFTEPFRFQIMMLAMLVPGVLTLFRVSVRLTLRAMRRRGWNTRYVAVLGVGRLGQITARTLERNAWTGIRVSYFISHHEQTNRTQCSGKEIRGGTKELEALLERYPVDAIYLAIPNAMSPQVPKLLQRLERFAVQWQQQTGR